MSQNNAGIDDSLIGGVIDKKYAKDYDFPNQWASYGWNVLDVENGADFDQLFAALKAMEDWGRYKDVDGDGMDDVCARAGVGWLMRDGVL